MNTLLRENSNIPVNAGTRTKVIVCYLNPFELPHEDVFFPLQAGKALADFEIMGGWGGGGEAITGDNTGDNISLKNKSFGEFTAYYWVWKNIKKIYPNLEYIGLAHYRRFLALDKDDVKDTLFFEQKMPNLSGYEQLIKDKLRTNDIIVSAPETFRWPDIETQYAHSSYIKDFYCIKEIIKEKCPEYLISFDNVSRGKTLSLYCIFAAKYELFNAYFEWLFPLLFEAEKRINISNYPPYQKRVFAFLAERLLNVYILHNKLKAYYAPVYFITRLPIGKPSGKLIDILPRDSFFRRALKLFAVNFVPPIIIKKIVIFMSKLR